MTDLRRSLLLLALLAVSASATAEEAYVTIPSGMTQTLVLQNDGSYSARIGIIARDSGPSVDGLAFRKFEVQYKEGRSGALIRRFEVRTEKDNADNGNALIVTVPASADDLLPGNYLLTVQVSDPAAANKQPPAKPQSLVFTLSKPAPSLTSGPAVYIERTSLWWGGPGIAKGELRLNEESRVANLSGLTLSWDMDHKPGVPAPQGKLVLSAQPFRLDAGKTATYDVDVTGDFPPGTYTGKILVRSPQLAAPVAVGFQLLAKRDPRWLIVLVAAGALMGFIVRVLLKRKRDLAEASINCSLALQKLSLASERIEEGDVRRKIAEQIGTLNSIQAAGKAADITAGATAALAALQTIEAEFKTKRAAFEPKVAEMQTLLGKSWVLPRSVRERFDVVMRQRNTIEMAFARNNLEKTAELLQALIGGPLLETIREARRWRQTLADFLLALESDRLPLSDDARQKLHASVEAARVRLSDAHPTAITVAAADSDLDLTHGGFTGGKDFFAALIVALGDFLSRARQALVIGSETDWSTIEETTRAIQENLASAIDSALGSQARQRAGTADALTQAWRGLLKSNVPKKEFPEIDALVKAASWDAAIAKTIEVLEASAQTEAATGGLESAELLATGANRFEIRRAAPHSPLVAADFARRAAQLAGAAFSNPFQLTGSDDERRLLRTTSLFLEFLQTLFVAILFVIGVYALNADTWIGTHKEMMAIFMLAFSMDLSAEGLIAVLKK